MAGMDYKKNLVDYFKKNLNKGYTPDSLKFALISQGYSRSIVERALEQAHKELAEKAPILKEKPRIKYEIIDENDKPIELKRPFLKKVFGFFKN
jgi:SOS response regulatory protein OraA/RecX